jgi:hypothetical protein
MRKEGELIELRMRPYHEHALLALGITTIEEAINIDFDWLAGKSRVGPHLASSIMDDIDKRYEVWLVHGMQYSGVPGVPDDPSPEEIKERAKEAREMTTAEFEALYGRKKSGKQLYD